MKKFSVLIALALLAVAGTGYAVTCAYDNVPAATLLVPYFRVSRNNSTGGDIPEGGTDTQVAIVNVSTPGVIAHVTVWNKYSKAVLDFNVPLTGKDVATFRMKDILNGRLNVNSLTQVLPDPCGINLATNVYAPSVGFLQTQFIRFSHPDASLPKSNNDAYTSISVYGTPAFGGAFRVKVWDSLDESSDIRSFTNIGVAGGGIIDADNPACNKPAGSQGDGNYQGDFSGYLTIDVVNYCTNFFPDQPDFYTKDAIATRGWNDPRFCPGCTPNVLMGDVFYIDGTATSGNISGDPAVALEYDDRLNWNTPTNPGPRTFYGRNVNQASVTTACAAETGGGGINCNLFVPPAFYFGGDGREPLGDRYGFRYLSDEDNSLRTWALVWRQDRYRQPAAPLVPQVAQNLCSWVAAASGQAGTGLYDDDHQIIAITYDNDENTFTPGGNGGPSGGGGGGTSQLYIFLEASRIDLLANTDINPGYSRATRSFVGGWIDMTLHGPAAPPANIYYNQAWVGVQHSGPGLALSVGYSATLLNPQFLCQPNFRANDPAPGIGTSVPQ